MLLHSFLIFILTALSANATPYTMQDLEALEGTSNFVEFFEHAKDIRPSLRGSPWKKITVSMADNYLDSLLASSSINQKHLARVKEISKWEVLANDEFYIKKRNKVLIQATKICLKSKAEYSMCLNSAQEYFKEFQSKEFGIELAEILFKESSGHSKPIWDLARPMTISEFGEFYCHKTPAYDLIKERLLTNSSLKSELHPDCLKVFVKKLREELPLTFAYKILMELDALNEDQKSQYHLVKILNAGELTSKSWELGFKAIKKLGADHQLREKLLGEFKELNTLPDKVFAIKDKKKALVISKQIAINFPEFLDYYTAQCLKWLGAEDTFPKGNPTPSCHNYFKLAKIVNSSPGPVLKKYEKIMNSWKEI